MKISIWYKHIDAPYGGANNFLRRLGAAVDKKGHSVHFGYRSGVDAVLVNAFVSGPEQYLNIGEIAQVRATGHLNVLGRLPNIQSLYSKMPQKGPYIIHRVDGVTQLYGRNTPEVDKLAIDINRLTNHTIFQSNFCRESFYDLGMQPRSWDIIHNGVPASVFFPNSTFKVDARKIKLIAMSWSKNTLKGFGTIAKLSMLDDVEVSFIGNWPSTINCEKVTLLGAKTEKEIALILRRFNGFIHAALNEPSSNAIIEALSSGLPILYKNSGGNRELAGEFGTELTDNLKISISNFREHIKEYRERILDNIHRFSIEYVADLYITAINHGLDSL